MHHEIGRLVDAGLLVDRRHGNNRLVRAASDSPLSRPLTELLALTLGPLPVLTALLARARRPRGLHLRAVGRPLLR